MTIAYIIIGALLANFILEIIKYCIVNYIRKQRSSSLFGDTNKLIKQIEKLCKKKHREVPVGLYERTYKALIAIKDGIKKGTY